MQNRVVLKRQPRYSLRPFVRQLWASSRGSVRAPVCEWTLPDGSASLVLRLDGSELRLQSVDGGHEVLTSAAVLAGVQTQAVRKSRSSAEVVGAVLNPCAVSLLTGVMAAEFRDRHVPLDLVCQPASVFRTLEMMQATNHLSARLELLEHFLFQLLQAATPLNPLVGPALAQLALQRGRSHAVSQVVAASGYSHRHFNSVFQAAVGVSPKRYQRLLRLGDSLAQINRLPTISWAELATATGFADQAHFVREFRASTGMTPGQYRAANRRGSLHVAA